MHGRATQLTVWIQRWSKSRPTLGSTATGESCPVGNTYLPAYPRGVRAGIEEIAPALVGVDPTDIGSVNVLMDSTLNGHPYVKTAIDMACWDLLGKATETPCWKLLGGRLQESVPLSVLHLSRYT